MWPVEIVVDPPFFDDLPGMAVAAEQMLVQALVPQPAVEAFHEAVLHRFSGRNVMPFDVAVLLPGEHGIRGEFGAIVGDDHAGIAAPFGDRIQFASGTFARDRVVHDGRQAFPAEVVDDTQDAEAASIDQRVRHEVE